jgi:hypothetical protein
MFFIERKTIHVGTEKTSCYIKNKFGALLFTSEKWQKLTFSGKLEALMEQW